MCKARGWRRNVRTRTWDINIDVVCSFETGHLGVGLLCAFCEIIKWSRVSTFFDLMRS